MHVSSECPGLQLQLHPPQRVHPAIITSIPSQHQRQHEPYTNRSQLPAAMHASSHICSRSPISPGSAGSSPPACSRQRLEPARVMRSAWEPHLVAIEREQHWEGRKHRLPAAQSKGEECPQWSRGPSGTLPAPLSRDTFNRGTKAPDRAFGAVPGACSLLHG